MSAKRIHSMEVNLSSKVRSSQSSNVITGTEPPPGRDRKIITGTEPPPGRDRKIITGTEPPPGGDRKIITGTEPPFGRDPKSIPGTEPLSGKDRKSISGSEFLAIMGFKNITGSESLDSLGSINITGTEFLTSMGFKDITGTESISSLDTTFITGSEFLSKIGFKNNIGSETNIDSNSHNTTDIQVPITPGGPDFVRRPGLPIFKVKSNGRTYLRIQEPYRDENGQSRNRNYKNVGKVDPKTAKNIYYPKFIESVLRTDNEPADLVDQNFFSIHDYCETTTKHFGIYHLLDHICDSIGLKDALICALPGRWESILDIAKYFAVSGEPAMYCDFWLQKTSLNYEKKISSQRMSELILSISDSEKIEFYTKWSKNVREHEYYALDVSSISSYSELIGDVDWGYNRDGENLPQINICMLTGEKTRIPIFPMTYNGAIKDVSMLVSMLSVSSGINIDKISIVTDKGLPSKNNIDHMLNAKEYVRFLVALPFTMKLAKNQVELVRDIIDCTKRTIDIGDTTLKGITQTIMWDSSHKLNVHIFHDVIASVTARNKLQKNLVDMREQILSGKIKLDKKNQFFNLFKIKSSTSRKSGLIIDFNEDAINKRLSNIGWMVAVSNHINNPKTAIEIYRAKDVIEKCFYIYKNFIDGDRLRVHSSIAMNNKIFILFIALIILSRIHKVMVDNDLYKNFTMKELIKIMEGHEMFLVKNRKILKPATATQKRIYSAFGINPPNTGEVGRENNF